MIHLIEDKNTDRYLVANTLKGDANAFKKIVKNTEGLVIQIIFKMVENAEDRKDLAQDVYFKVYHKLTDFKFRSKLSTWVGHIAYNTCINHLRKKKLALAFDNDDNDMNTSSELDHTNTAFLSNETEANFYRKQLSEILQAEIDKLSPLYKTLITLYHHEDLAYSEIAEITELPEGTVKSYLFRARKTLKDNLSFIYNKDAL